MTHETRRAFLVDLDNTLLDTDAYKAALGGVAAGLLGSAARFWTAYELARSVDPVVSLRGAIARLALPESESDRLWHALRAVPVAPFAFPQAAETLRGLSALGAAAIVTDGSDEDQRGKAERSGLLAAAGGRIFVQADKTAAWEEIRSALPADEWWVVDDKPRILASARAAMGGRCVTVQVAHGRYAGEAAGEGTDHRIAQIGQLIPLITRNL